MTQANFDEAAWIERLGRRPGTDHRCGRAQRWSQQAQVEDGDKRLVGEQIVALVALAASPTVAAISKRTAV